MRFGRGRRKLGLTLGFLVAGIATFWLACPLWFPWVLRPLASRAGVRMGAYERLGYARFGLREFAVTNGSLAIHAQRVEALVPSVWVWRLVVGGGSSAGSFLQVSNWDCQVLPSNQPTTPPYSKVHDLDSLFRLLRKWVPSATLQSGAVRSGGEVFTVPEADLRNGQLQARIRLPQALTGESIDAKLMPGQPFELQIRSPALRLESTLVLITRRSGLDLQDSTVWLGNPIELHAYFGRRDVLPQTASLDAPNWRIPGGAIGLRSYEQISGKLSAQWKNGGYAVALSARGQPAQPTSLPAADLRLRATGDTNAVTLRSFDLQAPFLVAQLSAPVSVAYAGFHVKGPATLNLAADLAQQHWIPLTGKLTGELEVASERGDYRAMALHLAGENVGTEALKARSVEVSADVNWPGLKLAKLEARFQDGSVASVNGQVDLERKIVNAGQVQLDGPLAQRWLPAGYSYQKLSLSGTVQGPLENLRHSGRVAAGGIESPLLQPCAMDLSWTGQGTELQKLELRLQHDRSWVQAAGALALGRDQIRLHLNTLDLATNGATALSLSAPSSVSFRPAHAGTNWQLLCPSFKCAGAGGQLGASISVDWPDDGKADFSVQHLGSSLLAPFAKSGLPFVRLDELKATANWSDGPATVSLDMAGTGSLKKLAAAPPQTTKATTAPPGGIAQNLLAIPLNVELRLRGDEHGLLVSNLVVNTATSSVAAVRGFLPVTLSPASTNLLQLLPDRNLRLSASVRPQAFFWTEFARLTGLRLDAPTLDVDVSGSWGAPQGQLTFRAHGLNLEKTNALPLRLTDLRLGVGLARDRLRLSEAQVLVQGQRVELTGELPLDNQGWADLLHKELPPWGQATAHLRVDHAQLAAFEPLFPNLLAPQGTLDVNVALLPARRLEGALVLRQARTRPLGNTAPLRDINATLRLEDRRLKLERASADLSGATVNLSGNIDLRGTNWLGGGVPPFQLVLHGTNVPLAREPDYIIRSDLDLTAAKTNGAPPIVFGKAQLRDSYYLSDLSALIPGKIATPSARPPYFSIDNPFLSDWRLAVDVVGARWLKVRTSLFNGEASANLHLQGTLKEPLALGVVKIDSGVVRFPFANLQVQQGLLTLASQDPYHPQLLVRAASRQFGYDIRMEVSGPVDAPVIQFSSNPSLSSEQILLMITAGQLPPGNLTLTPQQRAQTVALFLGRDLLSKLGLGDQSQDRLTISSGQEMSEQGRPTYNVEYKLTKRWSVEGEYDRFGDFNADLKWRIYSK